MAADRVFRVRKNRMCVFVKGYGAVPSADAGDDKPIFETRPPQRVGDYAIVYVEGQRRMVQLLKDTSGGGWLVDMGRA